MGTVFSCPPTGSDAGRAASAHPADLDAPAPAQRDHERTARADGEACAQLGTLREQERTDPLALGPHRIGGDGARSGAARRRHAHEPRSGVRQRSGATRAVPPFPRTGECGRSREGGGWRGWGRSPH